MLFGMQLTIQGYIEEYKSDGRITKEERTNIKNAKKSIREAKKELSKAIRTFKKEQKPTNSDSFNENTKNIILKHNKFR